MKLDNTQQEIVNSIEQNIIVAAGAGSGKTRVLIERIKHLLESGVPAINIVAITFTNMAAEEIKQRLQDVEGISDAFVGTIHSFANRIYKSSGVNYEIFDGGKQNELMRELLHKYKKWSTYDDYLLYLDLQQKVEKGEAEESIIAETLKPSVLSELNQLLGGTVIDDYPENVKTLCKKYHIITFDELIKECTKYYNEIGGSVDYLLVDELQDIGPLEYKFLINLNAKNNFFIGDDYQSIYGFKGADVSIFKKLMRSETYKAYYLENNYRNSREVLKIAKTVIDQVGDKITKNAINKYNNDGSVTIGSKHRLQEYLTKIKETGDFKDWFILVRTNQDLYNLSNLLCTVGIPFVSFRKAETNLSQVQQDLDSNTVKLLTVHSAKGLESKNVLLYGNFPLVQPSYCRNDDERKVMYVGITRAKDKLILLN